MASTCANCLSDFPQRSDGKGYVRHGFSAKLYKTGSLTVEGALNTCFRGHFTLTPQEGRASRFLCSNCLTLLREYHRSGSHGDLPKTAAGSYIYGKRSASQLTPVSTPRKRIRFNTPLKTPKNTPSKRKTSATATKKDSHSRPRTSVDVGVKYLKRREYSQAFRSFIKCSAAVRKAMHSAMSQEIRKEILHVFKDATLSQLLAEGSYEAFSWDSLTSQISTKAPAIYGFLQALLPRKRPRNNDSNATEKTFGVLFCQIAFAWRKKWNLLQKLNSLQLWISGCKTSVISQFNHMGWCLGPSGTLQTVDKFRSAFDDMIKKEKHVVETFISSTKQPAVPCSEKTETGKPKRRLFKGQDHSGEVDDLQPLQTPMGYTLSWDNIGRHTIARHQSSTSVNRQHLWALTFAAINRIPTAHLDSESSLMAVDIPLQKMVPSPDDVSWLKQRILFHVKSIICEYMPLFKKCAGRKKYPTFEYEKEMKAKSKIVSLGVIQENPATTAGSIKILEHLQQYVPEKDGLFQPCILYGDGLSCERHNDAQEARSKLTTSHLRLEGLTPSAQEFHKRMLLMQDTMDLLFSGASVAEKGTLAHIKNYFGHRSAAKDVSKCFNHAAELIEHATDSLVLSLAMSHLKIRLAVECPKNLEGITSKKRNSILDETANYILSVVWTDPGFQALWDELQIPDTTKPQTVMGIDISAEEDRISDEAVAYPYCTCKADLGQDEPMVRCGYEPCREGSWFHLKCLGLELEDVEDCEWFCSGTCRSRSKKHPRRLRDDSRRKYFRCLLWRGLNDKIRHEAVRAGDGQSMIKFWMFDGLDFWIHKHPKYLILYHRLITGVNGCFTEKERMDVTHNRTVNTSGWPMHNKAMDL